jgi:peroxiredoxin
MNQNPSRGVIFERKKRMRAVPINTSRMVNRRGSLLSLAIALTWAFAGPVFAQDGRAVKPDPRTILDRAAAALRALSALSYDATYMGMGRWAADTPQIRGTVRMARLPDNPRLRARLGAEGFFIAPGTEVEEMFRVAFDGESVLRLLPNEKAFLHKRLDENAPDEDLGLVTGLFGRVGHDVLLFEFLWEEPFLRHGEPSALEYEGRVQVGDVFCDVLYIEHGQRRDGQPLRERWFLGVDDHLPRRVERISTDRRGTFGAYVLTLENLRHNLPLDEHAFRIPLPEGYSLKPHKPRPRPALLSVGVAAPEWQLLDDQGRPHALADYRGKWVVLEFWATWCGPCLYALPKLQKLHAKFADRGVVAFGVNGWEENDPSTLMREMGYTFGLLLKGEEVAPAYRVSVLPTTYIVGPDGAIRYASTGGEDDLVAVMEELLTRQ